MKGIIDYRLFTKMFPLIHNREIVKDKREMSEPIKENSLEYYFIEKFPIIFCLKFLRN